MDGLAETGSGDAVKCNEAPKSFSVAGGVENPVQFGASTMEAAAPPVNMAAPSKKRGRPRKYGPDGPAAATLSPMPISASIPLSGDYSRLKQPKRRRFRTVKRAPKVQFQSLGDRFSHLTGSNFTPYVITVYAGEDIAMKIMSFSQREPGAVCVLSACGLISNVTLRQPNSSGGTLTYQGPYQILSLTGSFMPADNGIARSRSGGLSVSLAAPDGRVLGGGLAGLLVAASPVQIVLGSFLPGTNCNPRRQRTEPVTTPVVPATVTPVSEGGYAGQNLSFSSPTLSSFNAGNSLPSLNSKPGDLRDIEADNNASSEGESDNDFDDDEDGDSPSNLEISG